MFTQKPDVTSKVRLKPDAPKWEPQRNTLVSERTEKEIRASFEANCHYYGATNKDIELIHVQPVMQHERDRYGWKVRFALHLKSYIGWKVYMLHTGCFATLTEYEDTTPFPEENHG